MNKPKVTRNKIQCSKHLAQKTFYEKKNLNNTFCNIKFTNIKHNNFQKYNTRSKKIIEGRHKPYVQNVSLKKKYMYIS